MQGYPDSCTESDETKTQFFKLKTNVRDILNMAEDGPNWVHIIQYIYYIKDIILTAAC